MGKSQKKKATRRHNPVRVPDSHLPHGLAVASSTSSKAEAVLPIIQKLGSADATERTWACAAVSNLIQNDPSTRRLLQGKNVVGALITRLTDATEEVVIEAAGALRNLCIDGGYDICAEMYNKNIMAPLRTFPTKISTTLQQFLETPNAAPDGAQRLVYEFAENVITIFWCLSETSNKALRAVNDTKLTPFLMAFLQARERLPSSTVNAAAQCLYVLTEENEPTINDIRTESSFIACLMDIARPESVILNPEGGNKDIRSMTLRVLVSGILNNVSPLPIVIPASSIDIENTVVLPLLVPQLSIDLMAVTNTVVQLLTALTEMDVIPSNQSLDQRPKSDHKTSSEKELEYIEEKMRVTQLSLEILTGICATIPEPEPVLEMDPTVDAQMDDGVDVDGDGNTVLVDPETTLPLANGTGLSDLKKSNVPQSSTNVLLSTLARPLIALVYPTPLSFPASPAEPSFHPPTTSALSTIHIRALECLNNIFLALEDAQDSVTDPVARLSEEDKEGIKYLWNELWRALGKIGKVVIDSEIFASRGFERKTEIWEIAVGVMWGIARFGRGYLVPDAEQIQVLMEFCDANPEDLIKVRCIGTLECLAQHRDAIDANKVISSYLLNRISSPSLANVESCLQSAAALIDIYSDESAPYDMNFRQGNVIEVLVRASPALKQVVRAVDRRKPGGTELRGRGDEVLENLTAFIKYRRALKF